MRSLALYLFGVQLFDMGVDVIARFMRLFQNNLLSDLLQTRRGQAKGVVVREAARARKLGDVSDDGRMVQQCAVKEHERFSAVFIDGGAQGRRRIEEVKDDIVKLLLSCVLNLCKASEAEYGECLEGQGGCRIQHRVQSVVLLNSTVLLSSSRDLPPPSRPFESDTHPKLLISYNSDPLSTACSRLVDILRSVHKLRAGFVKLRADASSKPTCKERTVLNNK